MKKGILITKTDEPGHYKVQTGYRRFDDAAVEEPEELEEPEMEITLPEDALDALTDEPEAEAAPEEAKTESEA